MNKLAAMSPSLLGQIERGKALLSAGRTALRPASYAARKLWQGGKWALRPGTGQPSGLVRRLGRGIARNPGLAAVGLTVPIMIAQSEEDPNVLNQLNLAQSEGMENSMSRFTNRFAAEKTGSPADIARGAMSILSTVHGISEKFPTDKTLLGGTAKTVGEAIGHAVVSAISGLYNVGKNVIVDNPHRKEIYDDLLKNDDVLSRAKPEEIHGAYQTMLRFAPTLATDKNAVKAFLREAATVGGGVDYNSIKNLAMTEQVVNPSMSKHGSAQFDHLIGNRLLDSIAQHGLHKLAAVKLNKEGHNVGSELTLDKAAKLIGHKLYEKRATSKKIETGLKALQALSNA